MKKEAANRQPAGRILARLKAQELQTSSGAASECIVTDDGWDDEIPPASTTFLEDESW